MDRSRRVLVVEDDPDVRRMVGDALADEGFDVIAASDGYNALRAVAAGRPDVIVLDLGLPFMDGAGFAARWRERAPREDRVPIVAISALPRGDEIAREAGVDHYLPKPLELDELVRLVARYALGAAPSM